MSKPMDAKTFIARAKSIHGRTYDYSETRYTKATAKVTVICRKHGAFEVLPGNHTARKSGCRKCMGENSRATNDGLPDFIERARAVHGDKYDYSKSVYRGMLRKLTIKCRACKHTFDQTGASHLRGRGCKPCADRIRPLIGLDEFQRRCKKNSKTLVLHPETFDLMRNKVTVTCKDCDHTFRTGAQRLSEGSSSCPRCEARSHSAIGIQWLDYEAKKRRIKIQHARNGGEFCIPGTKFRADGYHARSNTIFEFHGDCYHGNPKRYGPNERCHPYNKTATAATLLRSTKRRERQLRKLGYTVVTIWESDWRAFRKTLTRRRPRPS